MTWFQKDYRDWQAQAKQIEHVWHVFIRDDPQNMVREYIFPYITDKQHALVRSEEKFEREFVAAKEKGEPFPGR
jgi:hypothetical protein